LAANLDVGSKSVFGVDVPRLESTRVSLTEDQTLNGNYHFSTLNVGSTLNSGSQAQGCDTPIVADTVVKPLSTWGKHYSVSFEILVEAFGLGRTEFLRFTTDENRNSIRIPALFVHNTGKNKKIEIFCKVGRFTIQRRFSIVAGAWTKVEIKQYPEDGETMYEVLVDGVSLGKVLNTDPREYEKVKVLVGWNKWYEIVDGSMRNLKADGNCLLDSCCQSSDGGSQGFSGDILYHYEGRNQSLYDMCGKLLLSTNTDAQTFTKERSFSQLSASNGVTTGTDGTDKVYVGAKDFNIKNLYDSSFKLDIKRQCNHLDQLPN
jgi:hypothetical protein